MIKYCFVGNILMSTRKMLYIYIYQFERSANYPDEIHCKNGTYLFWLRKETRDRSHKELLRCFEYCKAIYSH
jgi:hypothetical protein